MFILFVKWISSELHGLQWAGVGKSRHPCQRAMLHVNEVTYFLFFYYLSNRPQVSMVYRLINHTGCLKNARRICKSQAVGERFTNSLSVLPTSQVIYQPLGKVCYDNLEPIVKL